MVALVTCIVVGQVKLVVCMHVGSGKTVELNTGYLFLLKVLHLYFLNYLLRPLIESSSLHALPEVCLAYPKQTPTCM